MWFLSPICLPTTLNSGFPSNLGGKRAPFLVYRGFYMGQEPNKKGIRALLGILETPNPSKHRRGGNLVTRPAEAGRP